MSSSCANVMPLDFVDFLPFCFPFPPPLSAILQTCLTYKYVYDHACFCVHVYLLDLSSTYETNKQPLSF
jgi:hypothetical protein